MRSVIMCVDDDKYVMHTLSEQLNEWFGKEYIISKADSGKAALEIIDRYIDENVSISVVISDYVMPGMTGDVFLKHVHEREPSIKTIMLTGHSSIEGVVFAINNAGLYRFIAKPWDPKDLRLTITEALKAYEQSHLMTRLYNDSKSFHAQFADSTRNLKISFDAVLTAVVRAAENAIDIGTDKSNPMHCSAVKYYAIELAKTQGCNDFAQFEIGFAALLHEVGKYTLTADEYAMLREAKKTGDYDNPIIEKLTERTCELVEGFGAEYVKILRSIHRPYKPELPLKVRVLTIANLFDNHMNQYSDEAKAREALTKSAEKGAVDPALVKIFNEEVEIYSE